MWAIETVRRADKQIKRAPIEIQERYEQWKAIVRLSGPAGLKRLPGLRDEALSGQRKGERSSRLNLQWRVIYTVRAQQIIVTVLEVTPHDYRKR